MRFRISIVAISILASTFMYGQRKITLPPPVERKIDSPYKGEKLRFHTYNFNIYSNFHVNGFHSIGIDHNGRLWGCSPQTGFCSFDGISLYQYGSVNDFFDRFKIIETDDFGRVWIGGNGVGVISPSKGLSLDWYVDIGKTIADVHIRNLRTDSKGNVWVSSVYNGISLLTPDSSYFFNYKNTDLPDVRFGPSAVDGKDRYWFTHPKENAVYYIENKEVNEWKLHKDLGVQIVKIHKGPDGRLIAQSNNNDIYSFGIDFIEQIPIEYPEKQIKSVDWLKFDRKGQMYIGNTFELYKVEDGQAHLILNTKSLNIPMQSLVFDSNDGIWFTSSKGVFYIPSLNVCRFEKGEIRGIHPSMQLYQSDEGELMSLKIDNERVFRLKPLFNDEFAKGDRLDNIIECSNGYIIDDINGKRRFVNVDGEEETVPNIQKDIWAHHYSSGRHIYWSADEPLKFFDQHHKLINTEVIADHHKLFHVKEDGTYYFLSESADVYKIWTYNNKTQIVMDHLFNDTLRLEGAHYINDSTFYIATWGYYMAKITPTETSYISNGFGTNILYNCNTDLQGNFWLGGIEGGLNYVDHKTDSVININHQDGLKGGKVSGFEIAKNNDLVISTIVGVGHLKLIDESIPVHTKEDFFKKYELYFFDSRSGLMGQNFGGARLDDEGRIWVINREREWHLIFGLDSTAAPSNLKFESVQSIDQANTKKYFQFWLPGTEYVVNDKIEINHDDELLIGLKAIYFKDIYSLKYQYKLNNREWSVPQDANTIQLSGLDNGEHTILFRALSPDQKYSNEISLSIYVIPPFYETAWFIFLMILLGGGIIYLIFRWRLHLLRQRQKQLEQTVEERTEEIKIQKIEIETQHDEIRDSITYAKRIQEAILPPTELIDKCLPENFVLYKPKDVVAGDFYWLEEVGDTVIFAAADCTGHGVPGAMVSVVCHNALNRSVREFGLTEPNRILDKTRELVIQRFEQGKQEVNDGMDIAVCALNTKTNELKFAGANNGLYLIRNNELIETKGDKQPIGKFHDPTPFTSHDIQLEKDDVFYVYTDGFADQFGGDKGKKLKSSNFKKLLLEKHKLSLNEQFKQIDDVFENWKGRLEQVDDVCVIGIRI
jgi:serine phosphatase RsbU (regulator of sigma subunit)/ligand-binding sensor domain-containing protein